MRTCLYFLLLCMAANMCLAQTKIFGKIVNAKGDPVPLANVFLKDVLDGDISDDSGNFSFETKVSDSVVLIISRMEYKRQELFLDLNQLPGELVIRMEKASIGVSTVTITAGAFEASDEKTGTILKPLDIVQNAGAEGDLFGAIQTLPGVSPTANETGIFVRGGGAYETRTLMDRMIIPQPFFSNVPNIPARGRFDPFLFKGTLFSTGGYSAEYGQALSSVLLLETEDMPERTSSSLGLNLAGLEISHTQLWGKHTALFGRVGLSYLEPYFNIINQNRDWKQAPRGIDVAWGGRHKTQSGMWKTYFQHQSGDLSLGIDNLDDLNDPHLFDNENHNTFWNTSYKGILGTSWSIFTGLALSRDIDRDQFDQFRTNEDRSWLQSRITLGRDLYKNVYLTFGTELHYQRDELNTEFGTGAFTSVYSGAFMAAYAESDIQLSDKVALRVGGRGEYNGILGEWNLAPRSSMAFKTGKNSQVSLAYGQFFQTPQPEYVWSTQELDFEQATHYLVNYQWLTDEYTFRVEAYIKNYNQLIRHLGNSHYLNEGDGAARGFDLFWRDRHSIKGLDYWITYSFVDSRRISGDYPEKVTPPFVSRHTLNVIANYEIPRTNIQAGMGYTYASGRTFTNPNKPGVLNDLTQDYHNLNLNLSYLTSILGNFTVLYGSLRNPFGFQQVFGYTYSSDGSMRRAIDPPALRSFFLGMFISFY